MTRGAMRAGTKISILGLALSLVGVEISLAQGIGLPNQNRDIPLEILADDGIEWSKNEQIYIARGNARAKQGDVVVHADVLKAYYKDVKGGGTQIWRIDADKNVRIVSPTQKSYGDKAVYDVAQGILVLTGKVRMVTETDQITARDSLEYWEKRGLAVARGNAIASRGENRLRADILTAHFKAGKDGKSKMTRIDAFDNVLVSSPDEIATGKQGVYNVETGIAVLSGSVKVTRGKNQLRGSYAEINLNTGVSRLYGSGKQQVKGYFAPKDLKKSGKRRRNSKP
jgi:lipopolysaccharide export system protein LptA